MTHITSAKKQHNSAEETNGRLTPGQEARKSLPWYRRGGMHVNLLGQAFNLFVPVIILASYIDNLLYLNMFLALLIGAYATSFLVLRCKTLYCI